MDKSLVKSYGYRFLSSFEELEGKTVRGVFNISGQKKVFVTDACVLVVVSGVPMTSGAVLNADGIVSEIQEVTGITKEQYTR